MIYREITINGQQIKLIPLGDCGCGCGQKTTIPDKTDRSKNRLKGVPMKFIRGHHSWKGGIIKRKDGYIQINKRRKKPGPQYTHILEHVLRAEKVLGKPLPKNAIVHHLNGTKDSGTLVICQDKGYHSLLHQRMRAYANCGHANWRKCTRCKKYDDQKNLIKSQTHYYHKSCEAEYHKMMNQKRQSAKKANHQ